MKTVLVASAALIAIGMSTPVLAADMPVKAAYKAPVPVYSWTGCFVGGGIGYGMKSDRTNDKDDRVTVVLGPQDVAAKGWIGTAIVGCDYQVSPSFVVGVFADYDFTDIKGNWGDRGAGTNIVGELRERGTWSIGGRIGYLYNPQTLAFVTGGYTSTRVDDVNFTNADPTNGPVGTPLRFLPARTFSGGFIGGGIEVMLFGNWSTRTEYRFSYFGNKETDRLVTGTGAFSTQVGEKLTEMSLRWTLNYRFGGPVVANY
jgi:outer membrane immunogenic protein